MVCTFTGREVIRGVHRKEVCVWKEVIHDGVVVVTLREGR